MHNKIKTDFFWINMPAGKYMSAVKQGLNEYRKAIETVKSIPKGEHTFENTVKFIELAGQKFLAIWGEIDFLLNVHPSESNRRLAKAAVDFAQDEFIELDYDEALYKVFADYEKTKPKLKNEDKKLFSDIMRNYRRMGFGLPKAKRDQIKKKTQELQKLASDFRKNINDYKDSILVTEDDLQGLPESYISGLVKKGNKYEISLAYPDYLPFMENAVSEAKREELSRKYLQKGSKKNMVVLGRMVQLRDEIAKLLGYKNHAEYVLEVKMAKTPQAVVKFINSLVKPLRKKVTQEMSHLQKLKASLTENKNAVVKYHDILYLTNQDKKQKYAVDDELIREYFPLEIVTKGMFAIYEKLLSVKFKQNSKIPVWHPDVQAFEVYENKSRSSEPIAHFFLDMYPRKGKYSHAAVFPIIPAMQLADGSYQTPVVSMVCNFNKPANNRPSLLNHDEVETYFHEFGHVVHGVLTKARHGSQSGTSVQRDFVEAPSQMLENWVWDEKMLQILSGHFQNPKKKLPKELLKNMLKAKNHMISYFSMRQLTFGTFDMRLHMEKIKDIAKLYADTVKDYSGLTLPKEQIFPAGFGHMDGYDAGYYGYMWSKVYAADMFTRFKKAGLLNEKVGADYRKWILEKGSSMDAMELVKKFLGRKPNTKAFLKELGL